MLSKLLIAFFLMALCVAFTALAPEPERTVTAPPTLTAALVEPMRDFLQRPGVWSFAVSVLEIALGRTTYAVREERPTLTSAIRQVEEEATNRSVSVLAAVALGS